ncbi:FAD-dependent oxidoreductase [Nonomuraea sp. K274]|uniref:NADH:ubiquinone reductase (non-electrogenic) n=1 Tax=Nonomuraea cypriaca TaxID=1187855 RepID=A0A931F2E4_9ACTN|nr:FAD-dependent oxidoreductase [Nonomuraea cypriaca]
MAGRRGSVHVVVVGGGSTGVEFAGTLAELRRRTLPLTHPKIRPDQTSVTLVERIGFVLAPYKPQLRNAAAAAHPDGGARGQADPGGGSGTAAAAVLVPGSGDHGDRGPGRGRVAAVQRIDHAWVAGVAYVDLHSCGVPAGRAQPDHRAGQLLLAVRRAASRRHLRQPVGAADRAARSPAWILSRHNRSRVGRPR